jgi:hypothetical protein
LDVEIGKLWRNRDRSGGAHRGGQVPPRYVAPLEEEEEEEEEAEEEEEEECSTFSQNQLLSYTMCTEYI